MFAAYMRSVHNKSFKSRLYIVFRQLFSSAFVKCKKPIVSSFKLFVVAITHSFDKGY